MKKQYIHPSIEIQASMHSSIICSSPDGGRSIRGGGVLEDVYPTPGNVDYAY